MKKNYIHTAICAALVCLSNPAISEVNNAENSLIEEKANSDIDSIESIEVIGKVDRFMSESEIALNQSFSPDMREQISVLPGVNINGNGTISGVLQYRGLFGDRVRVKVDGTEIIGAGPNAMDPPLSHVVGSMFQQVTLYQGIAPVSVGAETIGGALEIDEFAFDINSSDTSEVIGGITASFASNDHRALSGIGHISVNNRYLTLSADYQEGDNYESGNGTEIPSTFYERSALKLASGFTTGNHRIDLSIAKRNTNESGTPTLASDILFVDALWYSLRHQYEISESWQLTTSVFGNQNEHDMNNFELRASPPPARFRLNLTDGASSGIKSEVSYENGTKQATAGAELSRRSNNSFIVNPSNSGFFLNNYNNTVRERMTGFVEVSDQTDDILWQFGMRLTEVSTDADEVGTSMAMMSAAPASLQNAFNSSNRGLSFSLQDVVLKARLPVSDSLSLSASVGLKERAPSFNELYSWFPLGISGGLADGRNYLGNLNLEKESARKIDFGLQYQGGDINMFTSVFYTRIDDFILGTPSTNMPANMIASMNNIMNPLQWNNTDAELAGFELNANWQLASNWEVMSVVSYVRGKQLSPVEQDLYRIAPLNGSLQLRYEAQRWQWLLTGEFVAAQNKVAEQQNETPTAGYGLINTQIIYELTPATTLTLLAENLFDKNYTDHLAGINRVSGAQLARGEKVIAPGRNIGVYLQYQF